MHFFARLDEEKFLGFWFLSLCLDDNFLDLAQLHIPAVGTLSEGHHQICLRIDTKFLGSAVPIGFVRSIGDLVMSYINHPRAIYCICPENAVKILENQMRRKSRLRRD